MGSLGLCPYFAQRAVCRQRDGSGRTDVCPCESLSWTSELRLNSRSHLSHPREKALGARFWFRLPNAMRSFTEKDLLHWCRTKISQIYTVPPPSGVWDHGSWNGIRGARRRWGCAQPGRARGLHPRLAALPAAGTGCDGGRHVPKRAPCWYVSRCDQDGMCCDAAESSLCPGAGPGEGKGDT